MLVLLWACWYLGLRLLRLYGGLNLNKSGLGWLDGWLAGWWRGHLARRQKRKYTLHSFFHLFFCFQILYFTFVLATLSLYRTFSLLFFVSSPICEHI